MDSNIIRHSDSLNTHDLTMPMGYRKPGFRTKIIGGHDLYKDNNGVSQLGEVLFTTENSLVLGGGLFVLEKVFGVASPLTVEYLNNIMNIATSGTPVTEIYPKNNIVCLFGVGIGGSGDTITSVLDVNYKEREIVNMIPFRVSDTPLSTMDATKYWFRKLDQTSGKTMYYLKKFENDPQIKVLWDDGVGDEDGSTVEAGVQDSPRTDPIETFVEINLNITKNDCREWFELYGNIEQTRVNSIGLFTGVPAQLDDGTTDYKEVKLFSKLNINNEMLTSSKDLSIIYRIYTS